MLSRKVFLTKATVVLILGCLLLCPAPRARAAACHTLFFDDFETVFFDPSYWELSGSLDAEPEIVEWPSGNFVVFHRSIPPNRAHSELTLALEVADHENLQMHFIAMKQGTLNPPPEEPFYGHVDADGIAISVDNTLWYPVGGFLDIAETFTEYSLNLDSMMALWAMEDVQTLYIRFFQYGILTWFQCNHGVALREIKISAFPKEVHTHGHAPDPPYPTRRLSNGARHVVQGDVWLGETVGVNYDGGETAPQLDATRDGVLLPEYVVAGTTSEVRVSVPVACKLDAWVDFNADGVWSASEKVFDSIDLTAGENLLDLAVPEDAAITDRAWARFRVSVGGGLPATGEAVGGEVEDYPLVIVRATPELLSLPEYTSGYENTITWHEGTPGAVYEAERALTADFDVIGASSGWIDANSFTFTALEDEQTHYYRVRAGALLPGAQTVWRQNRARQFLLGQTQDVDVCDITGVRLARDIPRRTYYAPETMEPPPMPFSNDTGLNTIYSTETVLLREFALYLDVPAAKSDSTLAFVVYEGGALDTDAFDLVLNSEGLVENGTGFFSSGPVEVVLTEGRHYSIGVAGPDTYGIYMDFTSPAAEVPFADLVGFTSTTYPPPNQEIFTQIYHQTPRITRFTTTPIDHANTSGQILSPVINKALTENWETLHYNADVPENTDVVMDILPESGETPIAGFTDLLSGADLTGLTEDRIRLRATLATSDLAVTPHLRDWYVLRKGTEDYPLGSAWSDPVFSTQINTAPTVQTISLLDDSPTRADTVRFGLVFSQSVTIEAAVVNHALQVVSTNPASAAEITGLEGHGDTWVVTAATGDHCGELALHLDASEDIVNSFGISLQEGYFLGPAYTLDFAAPTVTEITLLDTPLPAAWPAAFRVRFSETVFNVSDQDFVLTGPPDVSIVSIQGSEDIYEILVLPGETQGVVRLDVVTSGELVDQAGWPLAAAFTDGPAYQIAPLLFLLTPPENMVAAVGDDISFTVDVAGGMGPVHYQWYKSSNGVDFLPIMNAHDPVLFLEQLEWEDAGFYYCTATDSHLSITTPITRLTLEETALGFRYPFTLFLIAALLLALHRAPRRRRQMPGR